jgi:GAF domain-containing protein
VNSNGDSSSPRLGHLLNELQSAQDDLLAAVRRGQTIGEDPESVMSRSVRESLATLMQVPLEHRDRLKAVYAAAELCATALANDSAVSVVVGPPAEPELTATTSTMAQHADGAQLIAAEGPALTAWQEARTVATDDLSADPRWPRVARHVGGLPVRAVVAVPLRAGGRGLGVLTAYMSGPGIDAEVVAHVEALGAAVFTVVHELDLRHAADDKARQLHLALETRETIGLAKGIIMATRNCGPDEAFAALVRVSQNSNTKLHDVAATVVADAAAGRQPAL